LAKIPGFSRFRRIGLNLTERNLLAWTNYRGWDPEVGYEDSSTGAPAIARMDGYSYQNFRNWTLSVELVF